MGSMNQPPRGCSQVEGSGDVAGPEGEHVSGIDEDRIFLVKGLLKGGRAKRMEFQRMADDGRTLRVDLAHLAEVGRQWRVGRLAKLQKSAFSYACRHGLWMRS